MSQTYYRVTYPGLMYSLHTNEDEKLRAFLFYFIARYVDQYFSINDIKSYFSNDSKSAIKTIYYLLKMGWIDVCDNEIQDFTVTPENNLSGLLSGISCHHIVLSDCSGLPVVFQGFTRHEALRISALSCDFLKLSKKSRQLSDISVQQPVAYSFDWGNTILRTYVLYVGQMPVCISTCNDAPLSQDGFFRVISCLARRYYE